VPRIGGLRAWGSVAEDFDRGLATQESTMVIYPHVEKETRRGRDYVRVAIAMTVTAADVAQALVIAWRAFRRAAGDDLGVGWDVAGASAEVRPEAGPSTGGG
jgi:hypothetical protein